MKVIAWIGFIASAVFVLFAVLAALSRIDTQVGMFLALAVVILFVSSVLHTLVQIRDSLKPECPGCLSGSSDPIRHSSTCPVYKAAMDYKQYGI